MGRVWPRHSGGGRPLNSIVRWHLEPFAITDAAAAMIRDRLRSSSEENPAASLQDSAPVNLSPEALQVMLEGTEIARLDAAKQEHDRLKDTLDFRIAIGVYAAADCRPQDLFTFGDLQLIMPPEMRTFFSGYVLDYANSQFLLKKGLRTFVRMRDLEA